MEKYVESRHMGKHHRIRIYTTSKGEENKEEWKKVNATNFTLVWNKTLSLNKQKISFVFNLKKFD